MPRARSLMRLRSFDVYGFPEEQKLALDLTENYDDDEPTVKVQVPIYIPQINLDDEDNEPTLVMPAPVVESKYPGIGLIAALTIGTAMWFLPCYYFLMWVLFK